jgi:hypothetical protein
MPVATSIVMDVVSFAWSRAVSLRVGALNSGLRRRLGALIGHPIVTDHDTDVGFLCPLLFLSS